VFRPRIVLDDSTRLHCAASKVMKRANIAVMVLYYFSPDSDMSTGRKVELELKEKMNISLGGGHPVYLAMNLAHFAQAELTIIMSTYIIHKIYFHVLQSPHHPSSVFLTPSLDRYYRA